MVVTTAAVEGAMSVGNGGGGGRRSDEHGSPLSLMVVRSRGRHRQWWCGFLI
jgi:hypothetical protein